MWIIIQARSTSTRLPNKCMLPINGYPLVDVVFERCRKFAPTIVAVPYNDAMIPHLRSVYIPYYEGDEKDVLSRYYDCATAYRMKHICRITADCPLIPDELLAYMLAKGENYDFYTNAPCVDGHDVEIISYRLLEYLHLNAKADNYREHVTLAAKELRLPETFKTGVFKSAIDRDLFPKLSIDTEEDYQRVKGMYEKLFGAEL